jgi:hypothetical protein
MAAGSLLFIFNKKEPAKRILSSIRDEELVKLGWTPALEMLTKMDVDNDRLKKCRDLFAGLAQKRPAAKWYAWLIDCIASKSVGRPPIDALCEALNNSDAWITAFAQLGREQLKPHLKILRHPSILMTGHGKDLCNMMRYLGVLDNIEVRSPLNLQKK